MASFLASQALHLNIAMKLRKTFSFLISCSLFLILLSACGSSKYISKQAQQTILSDTNLTSAHIGISIYDPSANKYLYNYQGDKYFIPASNTKLFTCYAAMKYLGDSLVGARYIEDDTSVIILGTGDPSFLHPGFKHHPVLNFIQSKRNKKISVLQQSFVADAFGSGWTWNDYLDDYMAERSFFPIYGNVVRFYIEHDSLYTYPKLFKSLTEDNRLDKKGGFKINRSIQKNDFYTSTDFHAAGGGYKNITVPFYTGSGGQIQAELLGDTLHQIVESGYAALPAPKFIHSQPTDSLLKPMMHRSDNFFAEQTLLMVSNEMTGIMNDAKIIDSLLKTDYKDLPQKPKWVDGSGLSRYNLFSPNDFVTVLNKMKNDFSWNRITTILATGGEGTLSSYYINLKNRIFAKTGTLSNNVALSGFLITKQNKTLIFSVLVNNHMGNTTQIRKAVEKFLTSIAEKY
jgi:serine-type D-Ala-D-Ala carboxypeptidase/endopeptidase (penicillin-binding protein 4)